MKPEMLKNVDFSPITRLVNRTENIGWEISTPLNIPKIPTRNKSIFAYSGSKRTTFTSGWLTLVKFILQKTLFILFAIECCEFTLQMSFDSLTISIEYLFVLVLSRKKLLYRKYTALRVSSLKTTIQHYSILVMYQNIEIEIIYIQGLFSANKIINNLIHLTGHS